MKNVTLLLALFFSPLLHAAHISSYGAVCDGVTDDISAFNNAAADIQSGAISSLTLEGNCSLSQPWVITGDHHYGNVVIHGPGVTLNNTVVVNGSGISIKGLSVTNSPSHGFVFLRGQGASHDLLTATSNNGHGFYFGIDNGLYGENSQISNVLFSMLSAINNSGDGFQWDGNANANRSWLNANTFIHPIARGNSGNSWRSVAGSGPNGDSRISYNTIISAQFEVNGGIADFGLTSATTFVGGHFVDRNAANESVVLGRINYSFGGRYVGDVVNKADNIMLSNTSAAGEGARLHYLPHQD